ncbi:MAG: DUF1648 domain-containing protein [Candidatus Eremiobacteraeota bacterium]|nr:DUF1648 domain-containing protein [Candidatus Eremiobacteraeota bacterium]MBV8264334.1 DUF1648 domain-containing protein [Candidatus Eremiobacteraeota bacterium]
MRASHIALIAALAIAAFQLAYFYPQLPPVVASHFNAAGVATGWQPKALFIGILCLVYALFALISWAMPHLIMTMPPELIHLPNKAYWLAPQRREQTAHVLGDQMGWFGALEVGFVTCVTQLAINANLMGANANLGPGLLFVTGAFVLVLIVWTVQLYRTFSRTSL